MAENVAKGEKMEITTGNLANEKKQKLSAKEIQFLLVSYIYGGSKGKLITNYYLDRWEADLLLISPRGYVNEYEIKISRGDFFQDAKKNTNCGLWQNENIRYKHDLIKAGKREINRFYYVTPKNLIQVEELPKWAGLIEVGSREVVTKKIAKLVRKEPIINMDLQSVLFLDVMDKYYNRYLVNTYFPKTECFASELRRK